MLLSTSFCFHISLMFYKFPLLYYVLCLPLDFHVYPQVSSLSFHVLPCCLMSFRVPLDSLCFLMFFLFLRTPMFRHVPQFCFVFLMFRHASWCSVVFRCVSLCSPRSLMLPSVPPCSPCSVSVLIMLAVCHDTRSGP